jgi:hypothetical protein
MNMGAYWNHLKSYSIDSVRKAMAKASSDSPHFFPTAPQIAAHATVFDKHPPTPGVCCSAGLLNDGKRLPESNPWERLAVKYEQKIASGIEINPKEASKMAAKLTEEMKHE